jgi:hypothetical protein
VTYEPLAVDSSDVQSDWREVLEHELTDIYGGTSAACW